MSKLAMLKKMIRAEESRDKAIDALFAEMQKVDTLRNALDEAMRLINEALDTTSEAE